MPRYNALPENDAMTLNRKALAWFLIAALAALLAYASFRAYLNPALILDFANSVAC